MSCAAPRLPRLLQLLLRPTTVCACIVLLGGLLQGTDARKLQINVTLAADGGSQLRIRRDNSAAVRQAVIKHLHKYAYLPSTEPSNDELRKALRTYQAVAGIPTTGEIDLATVAATHSKRCSRPDSEPAGPGLVPANRAKRYALPNASKWPVKHFNGHKLTLKWFISKYSTDLDKAATRKTIHKAFDLWAKQIHIPQMSEGKHHQVTLEFEEAKSENEAEINIRWEVGAHGDNYPFDGEGDETENVLAHTFYPDYRPHPLNGDIHFDDAEKWSLQVGTGTFFPYVLVHEIGHALGLQHSHSSTAVMNPHYKDIPIDSIKLHADDKCGINWNIMGPSNWCLFVWITSEVVLNHSNNSGGNNNKRASQKEKLWAAKKLLWHHDLPLCKDENSVRGDLIILLSKHLHFSDPEAVLYAEVCCRFLDGVDKYRSKIGQYVGKLNDETGKTKEFVSTPEDGKTLSRRALHRTVVEKPSVLDENHFNEDFFDAFFTEY